MQEEQQNSASKQASEPVASQPQQPVESQGVSSDSSQKSNTNTLVLILLAIGLIISALLAGYFWLENTRLKQQLTENSIVEVVDTTPTPSAEQSENQTADWKTYTNNEYGFQIQYPINWNVSEMTEFQVLALITVTLGSPDGNSMVDVWVREGSFPAMKEEAIREGFELTTFQGMEALKDPDTDLITFQSPIENRIFQIFHLGENTDEVNQILSTFKFLD